MAQNIDITLQPLYSETEWDAIQTSIDKSNAIETENAMDFSKTPPFIFSNPRSPNSYDIGYDDVSDRMEAISIVPISQFDLSGLKKPHHGSLKEVKFENIRLLNELEYKKN